MRSLMKQDILKVHGIGSKLSNQTFLSTSLAKKLLFSVVM